MNKHPFGLIKVRYMGLEKDHPTYHAVFAIEPLDGAREVDGSRVMSALENSEKALKRAKTA